MKTGKESEKDKDYMGFRAPIEFLKAISDTADELGVSDSELLRRAIEKGIKDAVDEIQAEKIQAAKSLMRRPKIKGPSLNFDYVHASLIGAAV